MVHVGYEIVKMNVLIKAREIWKFCRKYKLYFRRSIDFEKYRIFLNFIPRTRRKVIVICRNKKYLQEAWLSALAVLNLIYSKLTLLQYNFKEYKKKSIEEYLQDHNRGENATRADLNESNMSQLGS